MTVLLLPYSVMISSNKLMLRFLVLYLPVALKLYLTPLPFPAVLRGRPLKWLTAFSLRMRRPLVVLALLSRVAGPAPAGHVGQWTLRTTCCGVRSATCRPPVPRERGLLA